jgi:hypothetical protein
MMVRWHYIPVTPAQPVPVYDSGQRVGTMIVTPVAEGYEARWYKVPASLPPGTTNIPLSQLEFMFGGVYGKDRNLIRELAA